MKIDCDDIELQSERQLVNWRKSQVSFDSDDVLIGLIIGIQFELIGFEQHYADIYD